MLKETGGKRRRSSRRAWPWLCEQVKAWHPAVLAVVGGHHATVAPHDFVSPFIDLVVVGEGVFAFRTIVERFERGDAFTGIPGVVFATGGELVMEAPPTAIDLDALPFPDRTLTAQYRKEYRRSWADI